MLNNLGIGKTGLKSIQTKMDVISKDLANINTIGYKETEITFQELVHNRIGETEYSISSGTKVNTNTTNFRQGGIIDSPSMLHMAIEGSGFFGVRDGSGNLFLTRNGSFKIDEELNIVDDNKFLLDTSVIVPIEEWGNIDINRKGEIYTEIDGNHQLVGNVILYNPEVLDSLTFIGEGKYLPSTNVSLYNSLVDDEDFGSISQYMLENSNVDIISTMAEMITAQRAYSLSSKSIQTTDDIVSIINDIKR